jgi:hypothetical protein
VSVPLVKVWNDNTCDHKETFKGATISIPAQSFIEMEYEEAVEFRGQFTGVAKLGKDGKPDKTQFKMIRVERPPIVERDDSLVNHANGKRASSVSELTEALREFAGQRVTDKDAEDASKKAADELRADNARLAAELAALKAKRGPGRPPKEI